MRFHEIVEALERSDKVAAARNNAQPVNSNGAFETYKEQILMAVRKSDLDNVTIYRGIPHSTGQFYLIDPTNWDRVSANTSNFSNLIFNNSDRWEGYPKRKIICTTNKGITSGYGNAYVVVPLQPNAKIGICPRYDMWQSFEFHEHDYSLDVNEMNRFIQEAFRAYDVPVRDDNWEAFKASCAQLDQRIAQNPSRLEVGSRLQYIPDEVQKGFASPAGILDYLEQLYDPSNNNFKVVDWFNMHNGQVNNRNEVWLDTPVLLIDSYVWARYRDKWLEMAFDDEEPDEIIDMNTGAMKTKVWITGLEAWKAHVKEVHMNEYLGSDWLNFEKVGTDKARATTHDGSEVIGEYDIAADKGWFMKDA